MQVHIGVNLSVRRQRTVAFRVGHCAVYGKILILNVLDKLFEVFMIVSSVFFIEFIRGAENGIKRIHTDTTLETSRGFLSAEPLHLYLFNQIFRTLMDMCEAVDLFSG